MFRLWVLALALGCASRLDGADRPNLLVLLADDMRPDAIAALGHPDVQTPNLDALVRRGTAFTRAHIMGGLQGAVCVPSRAMLLSGRSLFAVSEQLKDTPTWPAALRQAGYVTHMTGKWHNGAASLAVSFPTARSVFLGGMTDQYKAAVVDVGPDGKPAHKRPLGRHTSEAFADEAVRFLGARDGATPWALYVPFTAPHDPRQAPDEYRRRYDPAKLTLPANFLPQHPFDNGELRIRDELLEAFPRIEAAVRRHLADYYAIITHLDAQIGRVLAAVKPDQRANTVVVFAADNGLAVGSHGLMGKQNLYEHSAGVPLVAAGPGVRPGVKSDALVYLLDLCPTLCELGGAPAPGGGVGRSLVPLLVGAKTTHRDAVLLAYRGVQRGVCDGRWKVIWYPAIDRWQLFDLTADPHETADLAADPAHADRLAGLKRKLAGLRAEFGDRAELPGKK